MAMVPNRGGAFRAIGARIKTARAAKQGAKASQNYKAALGQHGANVKAFGSGQNANWTPSKQQQEHEQNSQTFMNW